MRGMTYLPVFAVTPNAKARNDDFTMLQMPQDLNEQSTASPTPRSHMHCELWKVRSSCTPIFLLQYNTCQATSKVVLYNAPVCIIFGLGLTRTRYLVYFLYRHLAMRRLPLAEELICHCIAMEVSSNNYGWCNDSPLLKVTLVASNSVSRGPARARRSQIVHKPPTVDGCVLH
jgi:hypothetical protein